MRSARFVVLFTDGRTGDTFGSVDDKDIFQCFFEKMGAYFHLKQQFIYVGESDAFHENIQTGEQNSLATGSKVMVVGSYSTANLTCVTKDGVYIINGDFIQEVYECDLRPKCPSDTDIDFAAKDFAVNADGSSACKQGMKDGFYAGVAFMKKKLGL